MQGVSILVYDSTIASPGSNRFHHKGFVYIEAGVIRAVGEGEPPYEYEAANLVIGGAGRLVIPGFASAHTHLLLYPLRHVLEHGDPASDPLASRLAEAITEREAYTLALLALYELTMHGVTMVQAVDPFGEAVVRAMRDAGVRGVVAIPLPGCKYSRSDWKEQLQLLAERKSERIRVAISPCTSSDLELAVKLRKELGVEVHGHPPSGASGGVDVALHALRGVGLERRVYVPSPGASPPEPPVALGLDAVSIGNPLRAALVAAWQGLGYTNSIMAVTRWGFEAHRLEGGVIETGVPGDLVVYDLSLPPGLPPRPDTLARLLLDAEPRVETVIAAGQPVIDQGEHLLIPRNKVEEGVRLAERLLSQLKPS